jgi:hypothetical protein
MKNKTFFLLLVPVSFLVVAGGGIVFSVTSCSNEVRWNVNLITNVTGSEDEETGYYTFSYKDVSCNYNYAKQPKYEMIFYDLGSENTLLYTRDGKPYVDPEHPDRLPIKSIKLSNWEQVHNKLKNCVE